jgi:hypothetical protein
MKKEQLAESKLILFILFFIFFSCSVYAFPEYAYKENFTFSIENEVEIRLKLILKNNNVILDVYEMPVGAPDHQIMNFSFLECDNNLYLLVVFDWGSGGTMTAINLVELLIFNISDNKFDLFETIILKNTTYDGREGRFTYYRNLSYFYDRNKKAIVLFEQIEPRRFGIVETHSLVRGIRR